MCMSGTERTEPCSFGTNGTDQLAAAATRMSRAVEEGILANQQAESNSSFSFGVPSRTQTVR
jgi:hypothetical protein